MDDLFSAIDLNRERAVYRQVADLVAAAIERGDFLPGQRLPTVRQVAAALEVNFNTIARAYRLLAEQGLVITRQGQGTRVAEGEGLADPAQRLEAISASFLQRAYRQGFGPQEVRLELAAAIRRWLQEGAPPAP